MNLCVLGGTGFVGRQVVARLAAAGHRIRVPTRDAARGRALRVLPTVELVQADVHDPETLKRLISGCDGVIHAIGILNERGRDGEGFRRAHTELTGKVVVACREASVARLIYISGLGADGQHGPSHYLRSKGLAEDIIRRDSGDIGWTILQPSVIFGPGDSFLNRFAGLLRAIPLAFPLAMPDTRFAPVHIDDVVAAVTVALTDARTRCQTYQLCGGEIYTLAEIVQRIAAACGIRRLIIGLPRWLSFAQAGLMEFAPGKPFSIDNCRSLTRHSVCSDNGLAQLGIVPRSMERALAESLGGAVSEDPLDRYRRAAGR